MLSILFPVPSLGQMTGPCPQLLEGTIYILEERDPYGREHKNPLFPERAWASIGAQQLPGSQLPAVRPQLQVFLPPLVALRSGLVPPGAASSPPQGVQGLALVKHVSPACPAGTGSLCGSKPLLQVWTLGTIVFEIIWA